MSKIAYKEYLKRKKERNNFYRINFTILIVLGLVLLCSAGYNPERLVSSYLSMFGLFILIIFLCFDKIKDLENKIDEQRIDY